MIRAIAAREILAHLKSARFAIALLLCVAVFGLNALALRANYRAACQDHARASAAFQESLADRAPIGNLEPFVETPPPSLRVLFHVPREDMEGKLTVPPLLSLFPGLDYAVAAGVFLSLVALMFGYDAVTGERASGTLRLLFAGGVSRAQVLGGKLLGLVVVCVVPFLLSVGVGLLLAWHNGVSEFSVSDWVALALFVTVSVLYLTLFLSLSLLVSVLMPSSASSMLVLLLVWAGAVLVVPNVAPYLSAWNHSVESTWEVMHGMEVKAGELQADMNQRVQTRVKEHGPENLMAWLVSDESGIMQMLEDFLDRALSGLQAHALHARRRINAGYGLSRVSPFASFMYVAQELGHAGGNEMVCTTNQVITHAGLTAGAMLQVLRDDVSAGRNPAETRDMRDVVPRLRVTHLSLPRRMRNAGLDAGLLLVWTVALLMVSYLAWARREEI